MVTVYTSRWFGVVWSRDDLKNYVHPKNREPDSVSIHEVLPSLIDQDTVVRLRVASARRKSTMFEIAWIEKRLHSMGVEYRRDGYTVEGGTMKGRIFDTIIFQDEFEQKEGILIAPEYVDSEGYAKHIHR